MMDPKVARAALALSPADRATLARDLLESLEPSDPIAGLDDVHAEEVADKRAVARAYGPATTAAYDVLVRHFTGDGLLTSLRPFRRLEPDHLTELLDAVRALHGQVEATGTVPLHVVDVALAILTTVHLWALEPDGMLQRNKLLSQADLESLTNWWREFGEAVNMLVHYGACATTWTVLTRGP